MKIIVFSLNSPASSVSSLAPYSLSILDEVRPYTKLHCAYAFLLFFGIEVLGRPFSFDNAPIFLKLCLCRCSDGYLRSTNYNLPIYTYTYTLYSSVCFSSDIFSRSTTSFRFRLDSYTTVGIHNYKYFVIYFI